MRRPRKSSRRDFLGHAALGTAALTANAAPQQTATRHVEAAAASYSPHAAIQYPRVFTGDQLKMISFPLGGIGAGSLGLGGRGELRDWQIFNRADRGNSLAYAFPAIWAKSGSAPAVARVLESRILPPYEGEEGLGSHNAPGLPRLAAARFIGEYPLAHIHFLDDALPVRVQLEAFSPFIPLEPDDSGLPAAILRYRVDNPGSETAQVSIAWSFENPVKPANARFDPDAHNPPPNEFRERPKLAGLFMSNPHLPSTDALHGSFSVAVLNGGDGKLTSLRGWPAGRWWNSPLLFWDAFSSAGALPIEAARINAVGSLCLQRSIRAGESASYDFLLCWHFPNRTPAHCGWDAAAGLENTVIGNWYATRFEDAWAVAEYVAANFEKLEHQTHLFASTLRESTVPPAILDAASANLSTLASTTCFRTADGAFHGFEGSGDHGGLGFGNCTHVWNYETATAHLFPTLARSLRQSAFDSMDDTGAMHFRQFLPEGKDRWGWAAADGQMGQIVHAYLDWALSGDTAWLQSLWPRIRKAVEFAWIPGGWDANRDGVLEGVQHNTYDVEFYGPNPLCGVYYLAALRAAAEMADAVKDTAFGSQCRDLFENGRSWIDANLFKGGYYVQQIVPYRSSQIAPSLRGDMGAGDPEHPEFQVGEGCLVDQLVGQYLAYICGLGDLLNPSHMQSALQSIYRYNHKQNVATHACVQRTFVLNDESALLVCDYGTKPRPTIPFPYFAEVFTGLEHSTASHMIFAGMVNEGVQCIADVRARYDGQRRNPWDEAEYGHHYARAMASWSALLAISGFHYHAGDDRVAIEPRTGNAAVKCFWSAASGWGSFSQQRTQELVSTHLVVHHGQLALRTFSTPAHAASARIIFRGRTVDVTPERQGNLASVRTPVQQTVKEGETILIELASH